MEALGKLGTAGIIAAILPSGLQAAEKSNELEFFDLDQQQMLAALGSLGLSVQVAKNGEIAFTKNGQVVELAVDEKHGATIDGEPFARNNTPETVAARTADLKLVTWQQSAIFDNKLTDWKTQDPEVASAMEQFREKFNYFVNNIDRWSQGRRPAAGARIVRYYNELRSTQVQVPDPLANFDPTLITYLKKLTPEQINHYYSNEQTQKCQKAGNTSGGLMTKEMGDHWDQVFAKLSAQQGFRINNDLLAEILWFRAEQAFAGYVDEIEGRNKDLPPTPKNVKEGAEFYENQVQRDINVFAK